MSLLMQALKKAERAKQSLAADDEADKPSEEFDAVLALTPEPAPAEPPAARALSLDLEPMAEFSLEPLAPDVPAAGVAPRPSPSPFAPASDHLGAGLTFDLAPDPAAPATSSAAPAAGALAGAAAGGGAARGAGDHATPGATQAASFTTTGAPPRATPSAAPGATHGTTQGATRGATQATTAGAAPATAATPATASAAQGTGPSAASAKPAAGARAQAAGKAQAENAAGKPRGAARARAAAASANEPVGMDPERLRLIGLLAILALVVAGFAYYYWQAVLAPGAGARLPPVPMPPPGATGATPVQVIGAAAPSGQGAGFADPMAADQGANPMLAPSSYRPGRDDLERRLARTEQELAAAQLAIQNQLAAPRVERLPPVAAPDNAEIRVARAVQPARIVPAVESAYRSFTGGNLPDAQKQYENALRQEPTSRDALLGLAMVHTRQNQGAQAAAYYLRMLELDPNDSTAVAGLVGMRSGDTAQSESRLKAILAANPEAGPALFALGNLYAQQNRWSEAQQAFFRAYTAAPDNPDYAYNLAIGLDRLNQGRLALTYYQRALVLSQDKAAAFDRDALRIRMHELSAPQ